MIDTFTLGRLKFQANRRRRLLAATPPDRAEAAACVRRIDDILDARPRPIAVAGDGEAVLDDQSSWVLDQLLEPLPLGVDSEKDPS